MPGYGRQPGRDVGAAANGGGGRAVRAKKGRRRKRRVRRLVAYGLLLLSIAAAFLLAALLVCGVLYVREHFLPLSAAGDTGGTVDAAGAGTGAPASGGELSRHQASSYGNAAPPEGPEKEPVVVTIDAGHGGVQPGCEFDGVTEKEITLAVALLLRDELERRGFAVVMTRDGDTDVGLEDRCRIANEAGADFFVSIHCNSYTDDRSVSGFEGYYYKEQDGKRLAECIVQSARERSIQTRAVKEENYLVLRGTDMPAALLEIGFLSNGAERDRLRTAAYQAEIAGAVADGIDAYAGVR